jgi:transcriptional regulator with XRE-family HTH domain
MRALRLSHNKTLEQLSVALAISRPYISYLERGMRYWNTGLVERYRAACES